MRALAVSLVVLARLTGSDPSTSPVLVVRSRDEEDRTSLAAAGLGTQGKLACAGRLACAERPPFDGVWPMSRTLLAAFGCECRPSWSEAVAAERRAKSAEATSTRLLLSSDDSQSALDEGPSKAPHSTRGFLPLSTGTCGGSFGRLCATGSKLLLCSTGSKLLRSATGPKFPCSLGEPGSLMLAITATLWLSIANSDDLRSPSSLRSASLALFSRALASLLSSFQSIHILSLNSLLTSPHSSLTSPTARSSVKILHLCSSSLLASAAALLER